jgi:hypothetical protein
MMDDGNRNTSGGGIGFTGALFIVFLVLKLTHVVNWSWVWVFAPLWIDLVIIAIILAAIYLSEKIHDWRKM